MDRLDYDRFKNKDVLELAYKNRYMYGKIIENNPSNELNQIINDNLTREKVEAGIDGYSETNLPVTNYSDELKDRFEELKKELLFDEDVVIKIKGKKYILDKSQSELYNLISTSDGFKRGSYEGKLMANGKINTKLPKNEEKVIRLTNDDGLEKEYILQTETKNLYETSKNSVSGLYEKGKYVGLYINGKIKKAAEKSLERNNYDQQNFIFLSQYEKKMLVYIIDYFFNYKYNSLRNIILNSIYHNKFYKQNIEKTNNNYAISLDIEVDLCKLFIHLHLFTKYKKIIDTCETMLFSETNKSIINNDPEKKKLYKMFNILFNMKQFGLDLDLYDSKHKNKEIKKIHPILLAEINALKKDLCEKMAENRTELKNSIKYIQRVIIIMILKNNLIKQNKDSDPEKKLLSQLFISNQKYIYDIFKLQDYSIIKNKLKDITNKCKKDNGKYSFYNMFLRKYVDIDQDNHSVLKAITCKSNQIKKTMISNVCNEIDEQELRKKEEAMTKKQKKKIKPIGIAQFIDDLISLGTNIGNFAIDTIVEFMPQNTVEMENIKKACEEEVSIIDEVQELSKTLSVDLTSKVFSKKDMLNNRVYSKYMTKYDSFLNNQNIVKKMRSRKSNVFKNNKPIDESITLSNYSKNDIEEFNKKFLRMQIVTMNELNQTFEDFNIYTIIDLVNDLIKYNLIPEYINIDNTFDKLDSKNIKKKKKTNLCELSSVNIEKKKTIDCSNFEQKTNNELVKSTNDDNMENTFKTFILFLNKKLKGYQSTKDIKKILFNEYGNNICINDENYIKLNDFYNIFKSLAKKSDLKKLKRTDTSLQMNNITSLIPNDKFTSFLNFEVSRLNLTNTYDIGRFNSQFRNALDNFIKDNPSEFENLFSNFDPFDFNVIMYYFYDYGKEEEYTQTTINFVINYVGTQEQLLNMFKQDGILSAFILDIDEKNIRFELNLDYSNVSNTLENIKKIDENVKILKIKDDSDDFINFFISSSDPNFENKINSLGYDLKNIQLLDINEIDVSVLVNVNEYEIDILKSLDYPVKITKLSESTEISYIVELNDSQKN